MYNLAIFAIFGFELFQGIRTNLVVESYANYTRAIGAHHSAVVRYSGGNDGGVNWWYNKEIQLSGKEKSTEGSYRIVRLFINNWYNTSQDKIVDAYGRGKLSVTYDGTTRIMQMTFEKLDVSDDGVPVIITTPRQKVSYALHVKYCEGGMTTNVSFETGRYPENSTYSSEATFTCINGSKLYKGHKEQKENIFKRVCGENAEWMNHDNYACRLDSEREERENPLYGGAYTSAIEVDEPYAEVKKNIKNKKEDRRVLPDDSHDGILHGSSSK